MSCSVKKLRIKIILSSLGLLLLGGTWFVSAFNSWILIESTESQTADLDKVYNKINFQVSGKVDSWRMKQSHDGVHAKEWDELEIKIDKSHSPYQVSYHQYKDGKEAEYRASCYLCHANGPRLIRANYQSVSAPLGLRERVMIAAMNLRIKTYGRMNTVLSGNLKRSVPLKYDGEMENTSLTVKTCVLCHNSNTPWGRGEIKRQHVNTVNHLVKKGQMPPWPFKLSDEEKLKLDIYFRGF